MNELDELKDFISTTVTSLIKKLEDRIYKDIEKKIKQELKDRTTELSDRLDSLVMENVELKERLEVAEKKDRTL